MRVFLLFFCVASISLATTTSQEDSKYSRSGRFGLRFTSGGSAYGGGIDNKDNQTKADKARVDLNPSKNDKVGPPDYTKYISAGWLVPLQLEMTYGLTNAFELLLGVNTHFSGSIQNDDKYIMEKFGVALGYRYYFNNEDPIQAYLSGQLGVDLTKFTRLEGKSAFGFLFNINNTIGIFTEGTFALSGLYNSNSDTGKGVQLAAGLGAGLHLHF